MHDGHSAIGTGSMNGPEGNVCIGWGILNSSGNLVGTIVSSAVAMIRSSGTIYLEGSRIEGVCAIVF